MKKTETCRKKAVWRKGALHTHSLWSDGRSLPQVAVQTYKDLGYNFMCVSEHNVFPDEELWLPVAREVGKWPCNLSQAAFDHARELVPGTIVSKKISFRNYVRLPKFKELRKMFDEKGKFILIPGEEITVGTITCKDGDCYQNHFNIFNAAAYFPPLSGTTPEESLKLNYDQYLKKCGSAPGKSFFTVNHPHARLWDTDPMLLIDHPEITHFEICNCDSLLPCAHIFTPDKFWDFILAHRIVRGHKIIYAVASDDAHYYQDAAGTRCGPDAAWVMVNCPGRLTPDNIAMAMNRGDFYATCGVELEEIVFDPAAKKLSVKVKPEKNVHYRISFIVTKKNFDRSIIYKDYPAKEKRYNRRLPVIPRGIGRTALAVSGTEGSYTLKDNDLYVRAVIVSDKITRIRGYGFPKTMCAWTQPFLPLHGQGLQSDIDTKQINSKK